MTSVLALYWGMTDQHKTRGWMTRGLPLMGEIKASLHGMHVKHWQGWHAPTVTILAWRGYWEQGGWEGSLIIYAPVILMPFSFLLFCCFCSCFACFTLLQLTSSDLSCFSKLSCQLASWKCEHLIEDFFWHYILYLVLSCEAWSVKLHYWFILHVNLSPPCNKQQ